MKLDKLIPFNKPYINKKTYDLVSNSLDLKSTSGNGTYTKKCQDFFEQKYNFKKCFLTTSCSDALEMCALLIDIKEGDEVIMPSYNFVSSANAFILRGAKIIFADSEPDSPNISFDEIEKKITKNTKAVVLVHYAGLACDIIRIKEICLKKNIYLIEDAAHAIDSFYLEDNLKQSLGSIGDLSTFSFHETKNISCGEGGLLAINNEKFIERAEIIWEKGTNRSSFKRGEVNKYEWVDIGSSFLLSDVLAAYLYSQILDLKKIQSKRIKIWNKYYDAFKKNSLDKKLTIPKIKNYQNINGHIFYFLANNIVDRNFILNYLNKNNIKASFHYMSLNKSPYYLRNSSYTSLENSERFSDTLIRLPIYYDLEIQKVDSIIYILKNALEELATK